MEDRKGIRILSPFAMISPQWLELPMSRTNFREPKDVRANEVRLYIFSGMPTSSQALILKYTDGPFQLFGRPHWHSAQSWMNTFTKDEFSSNSFLFSSQRKRRVHSRSRKDPVSRVRLDFSTLPELLQINAIRGSFVYDIDSNALKWKISPSGVADYRYNKRHWSLTPVVKAGNNNMDTVKHLSSLDFVPLFRRMAHSNGSSSLQNDESHGKQVKGERKEALLLMKLDVQEGNEELIEARAQEAHYFRLQHTPEAPDGVFRLIQCDVDDPGSFRLERINSNDVGDYRLVPADGYDTSCDFHLISLHDNPREFRLLQSDPADPKIFHFVSTSKQANGEFRLMQTEEQNRGQFPPRSTTAWADSMENIGALNCVPQFRKDLRLNSGVDRNQLKYITEDKNKSRELIKMEIKDDHIALIKVSPQEAHYFRLQRVQESTDGAFRLVKSNMDEAGSFRLERIGPNDVGEYRLVPADGYESDDFRLVTLDLNNGIFRLLQADPIDSRTFYSVSATAQENGEFRLLQAAPRETKSYAFHSSKEPTHMKKGIKIWPHARNAENHKSERSDRYNFFHDVVPHFDDDSDTVLLPDITLYDSRKLTSVHHHSQPMDNGFSSDVRQTDLNHQNDHIHVSVDNDMDTFRQKYMDKYRAASPEVYNRLVNLGFRPARGSLDERPIGSPSVDHSRTDIASSRHDFYGNQPAAVKDYPGIEWRTQHFQPWNRITKSQSGADMSPNLTR